MNDYEVTKLRRELTRKQQLIKEEREDRENTEKRLVDVQAKCDLFHQELVIARQTIDNVDQIIAQNIQTMKAKLEQEYADSFAEQQRLKDKLVEEKLLREKLEEEGRNKETVISELSLRLRELGRRHNDHSYAVNVREVADQAAITNNNFQKMAQKYNKVCEDMENVMAENKILRKIHQIPDNFGFDLEEIKVAEKQELEDYKAQCRKLETEIEELEGERTQLRYRLRQFNTLYSSKGDQRYKDMSPQQLEMLDRYALNLKEGNQELPSIDKTQKEMEREIIRLKARIETLEHTGGPAYSQARSLGPQVEAGGEKLSMESLRKLEDQITKLINPLRDDMRRLTESKTGAVVRSTAPVEESRVVGKYNPAPAGSDFQGPMPMPGAYNDWSNIKEGYSQMYKSKIPADLSHFKDENEFNTAKAKYEIVALQLQNIESLKLLKEKQNIENRLMGEIGELRGKYEKCLKVQDQLFLRYFKEKEQSSDRLKQLEIEKHNVQNDRNILEEQLSITSDSLNRITNKNDVEGRCTQLTARLSISEAENLKLKRKYEVLNEEHLLLRESFSGLESKTAANEFGLKEKLAKAKKTQRELTFYINKILQQRREYVAGGVHRATLGRLQMLQDKEVNSSMRETDLRVRINQLENVQREINLKDDIIETLREDNFDMLLEMEVVKHRLEGTDPSYHAFAETFRRLITFINQNNISIMQSFKKFDRDGSGELGRQEFSSAIKALGFDMAPAQFDLLFAEFDLDGSQAVSYREFLRKLRRSGVVTHNKEEEAIYRLFRAIKQAGITVRKAFQIIDVDSSNEVTKTEMQRAFQTLGIDITSHTVDYIFKVCDTDMSGQISCGEFEKLFEEVVKESAIEEKEVFATELDWKHHFVLKIDELAQKYYPAGGLKDLFDSIDKSGNSTIQINELTGMFTKAGVQLSRKETLQLFEWLDRQRDGRVEFVEFVKVLEEAKGEKRRVDRLKFVQARKSELRREFQGEQESKGSRIGEERSLAIKLEALQAKHNTFLKKNERLIKQMVGKEEEARESQRQVEELEKSVERIREEYYSEKAGAVKLEQALKNRVSEGESRRLTAEHQQLQVDKLELTTQLEMYTRLFEDQATKNKYDEMRIVKVESENKKYYEIVKELQSHSDPNALLGKKIYELELSKRNEEAVSKKYEQIVEDLRKIQAENARLTEEGKTRETELINAYFFADEKGQGMQREIDALSNRLLPTVSPHKIEEMLLKMREISTSKSELERQTREMRDLNFKLQLRNDYLENERTHIQQMERRLRKSHPDESSQTIMDLTRQLAEYKMGELKAKREAGLLREKEEYYLRVSNANNDNIRELEEQLGSWEKKHNEREEFWRKRLADQMKLMEDMQREATQARKQQETANAFFSRQEQKQQEVSRMYEEMPVGNRQRIEQVVRSSGGAENEQAVMELKGRVHELQEELEMKEREIYKLKSSLKEIVPDLKVTDFGGGPMTASTANFVGQTDLTVSQLKNNARRFIDNQREQETYYKEEAAKISMAAQQSIDTLQRIIDDKNEQLKRKEHTVDTLKREAMKAQEEDDRQIQSLMEENRELRIKAQTNSLQDIMSRPTGKNFYPGGGRGDEGELKKQLERKDQEIKILQDKYDSLFISKDKRNSDATDKHRRAVERKLEELQDEREAERKRHGENEQRLNQKIKNLEKLAKEKDKKMAQLQKAIVDVKEMAVQEAVKMEAADGEVEVQLHEAIVEMKKGKTANDSKMEMTLQRSLNTVKDLTKKNKEYQQEVSRLKQEKLGKTAFRK